MLLQAITIDDRAYEVEKASKSFINTHIGQTGGSFAQRFQEVRKHEKLSSTFIISLTAKTSLAWQATPALSPAGEPPASNESHGRSIVDHSFPCRRSLSHGAP
jgi:hypothetical protein